MLCYLYQNTHLLAFPGQHIWGGIPALYVKTKEQQGIVQDACSQNSPSRCFIPAAAQLCGLLIAPYTALRKQLLVRLCSVTCKRMVV